LKYEGIQNFNIFVRPKKYTPDQGLVENSIKECIVCIGAVEVTLSTEFCTCAENASLASYAPLCVCNSGFTEENGICLLDTTTTTTTTTSTTTELICTSGMALNSVGNCITCIGW
jgi:hypothetical protein